MQEVEYKLLPLLMDDLLVGDYVDNTIRRRVVGLWADRHLAERDRVPGSNRAIARALALGVIERRP
jgi:hypothetical protein